MERWGGGEGRGRGGERGLKGGGGRERGREDINSDFLVKFHFEQFVK